MVVKKADSERVAKMLILRSVAVQNEVELRKIFPSVAKSRSNGKSKKKRALMAENADDNEVTAVDNSPRKSSNNHNDKKPKKSSNNHNEKKPRAVRSVKSVSADDPRIVLHRRIAKYFGNEIFFGTIIEYKEPDENDDQPFWAVLFDDGDLEDFGRDELEQLFALYSEPEISSADKQPFN